jgi:membrane protease YdiL (CAAX protease family)
VEGGSSTTSGVARRLIEVAAFVGLWMGIGEATDAGLNAYLLIGIPLTAGFQLWVRSGPALAKTMAWRGLFVLIAIYPVYGLIKVISDQPAGCFALGTYLVATIGGAGAAAYAFTHFDRKTLRYLGLCLATAGVIGVVPQLLASTPHSLSHSVVDHPHADVWVGVLSFLLYIPSLYVMEEVAFRGALDSHAHHEGERHGIWTAIYVSMLWGLWHAPVIGWSHVVALVLFQGVIGTFLSIFWRKSGNLGVSATTHAFIDSVRNAASAGP